MIRAERLTKSFNGQQVLQGIDLEVAAGECLVIMGANGAGKTTLLRILATLSRPTGGRVLVDGLDVGRQANVIRQRVGLLSHQPLLYEDLSAEENLSFYGRMYGVPHLEERSAALLEQVGLGARRRDQVRTFSRGMKQRLAIARILLHAPPILLMDEPYTGLDEQAAGLLDTLIAKGVRTDGVRSDGVRSDGAGYGGDIPDGPAAGRTVVLTTHDAERGLRVGDRAALLVAGRIAYAMDRARWDPARFLQEYRRRPAEAPR